MKYDWSSSIRKDFHSTVHWLRVKHIILINIITLSSLYATLMFEYVVECAQGLNSRLRTCRSFKHNSFICHNSKCWSQWFVNDIPSHVSCNQINWLKCECTIIFSLLKTKYKSIRPMIHSLFSCNIIGSHKKRGWVSLLAWMLQSRWV